MQIRFLGAAGTVTGSKTLLTTAKARVLVDCGLFQGYKQLRERNWIRPPFEPGLLRAVVLTHAHLDHSGWLPAMVRYGFDSPVFCTPGTADLLKIMWPGSGRIQEEDAAYAARKGYSRHDPPLPLYTEDDAFKALRLLRPMPWETPLDLGSVEATFHPAGHILGAASVRFDDGRRSVLFSGDLGRTNDLIMPPPSPPVASTHIVCESTYGSRNHTDTDVLDALEGVVNRTLGRGGMVIIPSFAVGRAQAVLWALHQLQKDRRIPDVPLVLDSPMASDTTALYLPHASELRLSKDEVQQLCADVRFVGSADDSRSLNNIKTPFILVSASGMLTGGRVLHHLVQRAEKKENTLLLVGYQAPGTRGRRLIDGETELKLHGKYVTVRCEVAQIDGFSAHADQSELVDWLSKAPKTLERVWLNHGEPGSADLLRQKVESTLGIRAKVAQEGITWDLSEEQDYAEAPLVASERHAAYIHADQDLGFLDRDDMRAIRLMLEYLKVEKGLVEEGITGTVVVFGSTRLGEAVPEGEVGQRLQSRAHYYDEAQRFGALVGKAGRVNGSFAAVATGGGPGIMEAANKGAMEVGASSIGLNITLPMEQAPNPFITPSLCFRFRYFALRKMHFLRRAKALVTFPGGYGTMDELYDALCLIQTKKMPRIPVVLVGREYWAQAFPGAFLADNGFIEPEDLALVTMVDNAEEAWQAIKDWYADPNNPDPSEG